MEGANEIDRGDSDNAHKRTRTGETEEVLAVNDTAEELPLAAPGPAGRARKYIREDDTFVIFGPDQCLAGSGSHVSFEDLREGQYYYGRIQSFEGHKLVGLLEKHRYLLTEVHTKASRGCGVAHLYFWRVLVESSRGQFARD